MNEILGVKWELLRKKHPEMDLPTFDDLMNRIPSDKIEDFQKQLIRQLSDPDEMVTAHNNDVKMLKAMFKGKAFTINGVKTRKISSKRWGKMRIPLMPPAESGDGACTRCVYCRQFSGYDVLVGYVKSSSID